jgi:2-C-methyl-D-erythritol 2,4-cyclodiphosphate synthase
MRRTIAGILSISENDVSVKATTNEQMGFIGREEGLVAYATVLLKSTST